MARMFAFVPTLLKLDSEDWDTGEVTTMSRMFQSTWNLGSISDN